MFEESMSLKEAYFLYDLVPIAILGMFMQATTPKRFLS